jgi:drug/metabolite transporter (DMT)-like permease
MSPSAPVFALIAAVLFGASTPFAKLFLRESGPMVLAGLLYAGSGIGLGVLCAFRWRRSLESFRNFRRSEMTSLAGSIFFGGVLGPVLLMVGLQQISASTASLLLNLESAFTVLIACLVFHEHYGKRLVLGFVFILSGSLILSWSGQGFSMAVVGVMSVAGACACWAIDNNLAKKVKSLEAGLFACMKGVVAAIANISLATVLHQRFPAPATMVAILTIGFAGYGLSLVLFILSLRKLGAARTSAYFSTAPFVGGLLSIVVLKEPFTWTLAVAGVLMAIGVYLHVTEPPSQEHIRQSTEHQLDRQMGLGER